MPKKAKEFTAMAISKIKKEGLHAVGGVPGLYLQIIGNSRSWLFRVLIRIFAFLSPFGHTNSIEMKTRCKNEALILFTNVYITKCLNNTGFSLYWNWIDALIYGFTPGVYRL